jgi:hypothetical protein
MAVYEESLIESQTVVLPDGSVRVEFELIILRDGVEVGRKNVSKSFMIWDETIDDSDLYPGTVEVVNSARSPSRRAVAQANYAAETGEPGPEWLQPEGAHNAYREGARVTHGGKQWVSLLNANVWEPGASGWTEVVAEGEEPAAWVQPTGAHDAYSTGDRVTHNDFIWISDVDANVWEPSVYGWTQE